ncbi:MAG: type II secretion system protein [Nitrospirae bacterium]|nr:type II secretion system protein [Nitrospirota bacterium]MBI3606131.1 type II secretion system protein [Nitrospirota bacterium]
MMRNQRGFTLIEVIITIVLLAILTSGLMAMFTTFSQSNGDPSVMIQASELAQEKMDQVIADRYNPARSFNYVTTANYPAENPVAGFTGFNRSVNVIFVNTGALDTTVSPGPTNYKKITVTVNSNAGSVTTSTLIGSY